MNNRQHGEKQAMKDHGDISQNRLVGSRLAEMRKELEADGEESLSLEKTHQNSLDVKIRARKYCI